MLTAALLGFMEHNFVQVTAPACVHGDSSRQTLNTTLSYLNKKKKVVVDIVRTQVS